MPDMDSEHANVKHVNMIEETHVDRGVMYGL